MRRHLSKLDFEPERIIATFHGMPEKYYQKGDPYYEQCKITSKLLRAALEWHFARGGDAGPRLAASLSRFWSARNHYAEGRQWLEQALAATAGQRTALRAKLLTGYGHLAQMQRDRHASLPRFEESLEIARELGDRTLVAAANVGIGIACTDSPRVRRFRRASRLRCRRGAGRGEAVPA